MSERADELARQGHAEVSIQEKNQTIEPTIVLKAENVTKDYSLKGKKIHSLKNLDLEIKRGEFIAVMGLSGSGKTTLLNILGCLDKPSSGKVFLENDEVTSIPDSQLFKVRRDKIGFVFQSFNLLPYLSARENVELAMESSKNISKIEKFDKAMKLLGLVGLSGREDHKPQQLSAGEQQRVAIARALANDPAVILADELTGNLDGKTKFEIVKLLIDLNLNQGKTIVIVTHDEQVAASTERILRLKSGRFEKERAGNLAKKKMDLQRLARKAVD
jgi:putative ABC transport system ATP-binding protein